MKVACFLEVCKKKKMIRERERTGGETRREKIKLCCSCFVAVFSAHLLPSHWAPGSSIDQTTGGPQQNSREPKKKESGSFIPFCPLPSVSSVWGWISFYSYKSCPSCQYLPGCRNSPHTIGISLVTVINPCRLHNPLWALWIYWVCHCLLLDCWVVIHKYSLFFFLFF